MTSKKRINFVVKSPPRKYEWKFVPTLILVLGLGFSSETGVFEVEANPVESPTPLQADVATINRPSMENLGSKIQGVPGVVEVIEAEKAGDGPRVILHSDDFFQTGTANLKEKSAAAARQVAVLIRETFSGYGIEIEGHTDDTPVVRQKKLYSSNWELSAARAASILHLFEDAGFLKNQLKVVGMGDSQPILPNRSEAGVAFEKNLSKNRRIILHLIPTENEGGP